MSELDHIALLFSDFDKLSSQSQTYLSLICLMIGAAFVMSIYCFIKSVREGYASYKANAPARAWKKECAKQARYRSYPHR